MDKQAPTLPSTRIFSSQPAQVGDGFFIQRALPLLGQGLEAMEPFLMLDHAGPTTFGPTTTPRGVGSHPHKGFQTVTLAYQGDLVHRDSLGNRGELSPGDVQWMTAGKGIVHEEKHGAKLSKEGGVSEMIQLWINLPASAKTIDPHYVDLKAALFPTIPLCQNGRNFARLVAGNWDTYSGPAETYSPLTLADLYLDGSKAINISLNPKWHTAVYVLKGSVRIATHTVGQHFIAKTTDEKSIKIESDTDCHLLFMSAEPINEPIASQGPFVMNTQAELRTAMGEFQRGEMGQLK